MSDGRTSLASRAVMAGSLSTLFFLVEFALFFLSIIFNVSAFSAFSISNLHSCRYIDLDAGVCVALTHCIASTRSCASTTASYQLSVQVSYLHSRESGFLGVCFLDQLAVPCFPSCTGPRGSTPLTYTFTSTSTSPDAGQFSATSPGPYLQERRPILA